MTCKCSCGCRPDGTKNESVKLKLISDGTTWGTKVVDAATGKLIGGVTQVEFTAAVNGLPPRLRLDVVDADIEVECEANITRIKPCTCQSDTQNKRS